MASVAAASPFDTTVGVPLLESGHVPAITVSGLTTAPLVETTAYETPAREKSCDGFVAHASTQPPLTGSVSPLSAKPQVRLVRGDTGCRSALKTRKKRLLTWLLPSL